jgi:hypothetical protein
MTLLTLFMLLFTFTMVFMIISKKAKNDDIEKHLCPNSRLSITTPLFSVSI